MFLEEVSIWVGGLSKEDRPHQCRRPSSSLSRSRNRTKRQRKGEFAFFACAGLQHVGSSSLTREQTCAPCIGSMESQPLDTREVLKTQFYGSWLPRGSNWKLLSQQRAKPTRSTESVPLCSIGHPCHGATASRRGGDSPLLDGVGQTHSGRVRKMKDCSSCLSHRSEFWFPEPYSLLFPTKQYLLIWNKYKQCINPTFSSVQSVQLLSLVWLFATPWTAACQTSLSITYSQSLLKLMSIESVMPSNHLSLCRPLFLPPSIFPGIRIFSNESVLCIRCPKYWSFSFSTSPSNEYSGLISFRMDWLDQSKGLSRVFPYTTVQKYQFFSTQLSL